MASLPLSNCSGSLIWSEGGWEASSSMPDDYQCSGSLIQDPAPTKQSSAHADLLTPFFSSLYAQADITDRINSVQEASLQPLNLEDCSSLNRVLQETTLEYLPLGLNCEGMISVSSINNLYCQGSLQMDSTNSWASCRPKIDNMARILTETNHPSCSQTQTESSLADDTTNQCTTPSEHQTNACYNNDLASPIIITESSSKATIFTAPVIWGVNLQELDPVSRIEPAAGFTMYDHILSRKNCNPLIVTRSRNANQKVEYKMNSFEELERTTGDTVRDDEEAAKRLLYKRRCSISETSNTARLALNTNGRPRAKRGSATDPQSIYARQRRERINERLKTLQNLVPNGAKVDIVTMLEEAINYVKFLQLQVKLLSSDEYWMYAPTTYNGIVCFDMPIPTHASVANSP